MRFSKLPPQESAALVAQGRKELVHEVAVGAMQLNDVEAGLFGALSSGLEGFDDGGDAFFIQGLGRGEFFIERKRAGSERWARLLRFL